MIFTLAIEESIKIDSESKSILDLDLGTGRLILGSKKICSNMVTHREMSREEPLSIKTRDHKKELHTDKIEYSVSKISVKMRRSNREDSL